jgi:predicted RNA-binding Zn-ribbon protein involved in translation (DUF1610 family)
MATNYRKCTICGTSLTTSSAASQTLCNSCRSERHIKRSSSTVYRFLNYKLQVAKDRAKRQKTEFEINVEDLYDLYEEQGGNCAISRLPMLHLTGDQELSLSIDRKDNRFGYLKNNVQLVCTRINNMKSNLNQEDFIWWCKAVANGAD